MERLTPQQREALIEIGPPGAGPIHDEVFADLERRGWGYWNEFGLWCVTDAGRRALELDDLARGTH